MTDQDKNDTHSSVLFSNSNESHKQEIDQGAKYAIDKLAEVALKVNSDAKRKLFFRLGVLLLIIFLIFWAINSQETESPSTYNLDHIALLSINDPILAADDVIEQLDEAFENDSAKVVFLLLNSPGGSAVQSALIYDRIMKLKQSSPKPIYVFISDVCASGCYYLASAADEIYAHPASLIGSIGVIIQSFGAGELLKKIGIEPRTYKAGKDKDFLSPLSSSNIQQEKHILSQLDLIHQKFITDVKNGRGDKLKTDQADLFTGLIWAGIKAKEFGLIDDFYYYDDFAKEKFQDLDYANYQQELDWADRIFQRISSKSQSFVQNLQNKASFNF